MGFLKRGNADFGEPGQTLARDPAARQFLPDLIRNQPALRIGQVVI
jgi:hypothetical protein